MNGTRGEVTFEHEGRQWRAWGNDTHLYINAVDFWRFRVAYNIVEMRVSEFHFGPSFSGDARIGMAKCALAGTLAEKAKELLL